MIIISSGFPKSASTLLFLYTESLINLSGKPSGQKLFRRFNREGFTPHFGVLNTPWYIFASMFGPVVIKTHAGPTFFIRLLISFGLAKGYYSVRDPRDAMLSALDHGNKARTKGITTDSDNAFAPFKEWKNAIPAFRIHCERYYAWKKDGRAIFPRYENLVADPTSELEKVVDHIGRPSLKRSIEETVVAFDRSKKETKNFNKGDTSRYRQELSSEQIAAYEKEFGSCILAMGYTLENQK